MTQDDAYAARELMVFDNEADADLHDATNGSIVMCRGHVQILRFIDEAPWTGHKEGAD